MILYPISIAGDGDGIPGGADTQVQYNKVGAFGGDASFNFNDTTKIVDMDGLTITGTIATGLDLSGGAFATADINLTANPIIKAGTRKIARFEFTNHNVFLGSQAAFQSPGTDNVFVGYQAGIYNDDSTGTGKRNVYIGYQAGYGAAVTNKGQNNVAIGYKALLSNQDGYYNVAVGAEALDANQCGFDNFALGAHSLGANIGGSHNVAIGYLAAGANTEGDFNIAIGAEALRSSILMSRNIAIGYQALNQTGKWNTAIGYMAGFVGADKQYGTFIGYQAGYANNGDGCVCVGWSAGRTNSTGAYCINIGWAGGYHNTSANRLIIGNQLYANEATEITNSIIYGIMATTPANQYFSINAAHIIVDDLPSGSDQANAGAAAGELWVTSGHVSLLDNIVMRGA